MNHGRRVLALINEGAPSQNEYITAWIALADELEQALTQINAVIYAQGAPLGSPEYFRVRTLCCDQLFPKVTL